jgi:hypothetical protein
VILVINGSRPILLTTRYRFDMSSVGLLSFSFFTLTWFHFSGTFCLYAEHHIFWIQHLQVVCILRLHSVCGRPATIFYTALKRTIYSFHSWHTEPRRGESFLWCYIKLLSLTLQMNTNCFIQYTLNNEYYNPFLSVLSLLLINNDDSFIFYSPDFSLAWHKWKLP